MKKNMLIVLSISIALLALIGCEDKESKLDLRNPDKPYHVPILWVEAILQQDNKAQWELLDEKADFLLTEFEADPNSKNNKLTDFQLTEWKLNEETYIYYIEYDLPNRSRLGTQLMRVIKTRDGWKRDKYSDLKHADKYLNGITPTTLRRFNEQ